MKKYYKNITKLLLAVLTISIICGYSMNPVYSTNTQEVKLQTAKTTQNTILKVSPSDVVENPAKYLNKTISFNAEFIAFTSLGLDYKPAFRDASKYIGILIKRDNVADHTIPLSEMKIFLTRETAEKHLDMEQGDKIKIIGNVFSNAMGDPWIDVETFAVVEKNNKNTNNK